MEASLACSGRLVGLALTAAPAFLLGALEGATATASPEALVSAVASIASLASVVATPPAGLGVFVFQLGQNSALEHLERGGGVGFSEVGT